MLEQATIGCPYCGEPIEIVVEMAIEPEAMGQRYVEDCQVCCKPMVVDVTSNGGAPMVTASRDDE